MVPIAQGVPRSAQPKSKLQLVGRIIAGWNDQIFLFMRPDRSMETEQKVDDKSERFRANFELLHSPEVCIQRYQSTKIDSPGTVQDQLHSKQVISKRIITSPTLATYSYISGGFGGTSTNDTRQEHDTHQRESLLRNETVYLSPSPECMDGK